MEGQYTPGNRNSAATIDHTEVHVDLTKNNEPSIQTGGEVKYSNEQGATVIVQTKPDPADKPKDFVVTSCFVIMLCNFCFGFAGWHFGLKANNAWQLGDEVESRKQAKIFVILGVIAGIITSVVKANNAWQLGDEVESRMQAKRAKIFVILGVIAGIITWVLALTLFFTVSPLRPGA